MKVIGTDELTGYPIFGDDDPCDDLSITCGRCIHDGESGDISGSTCYLCRRNSTDHRIDWFEEKGQ